MTLVETPCATAWPVTKSASASDADKSASAVAVESEDMVSLSSPPAEVGLLAGSVTSEADCGADKLVAVGDGEGFRLGEGWGDGESSGDGDGNDEGAGEAGPVVGVELGTELSVVELDAGLGSGVTNALAGGASSSSELLVEDEELVV